jgi:hypothetical protein
MIAAAALLSGLAVAAPAQDRARDVIDRTQGDLRRASDSELHRGKEVSRYENAQKHLSDFDREMTRGHFDKGRLDAAIDDLKDVVDHNTLDPEDRDALRRDLSDLRILRDDRDRP